MEENVSDLAESILLLGLLHPIVIRWKDDLPHLVAGETRLKAITKIYMEQPGKRILCNGLEVPLGFLPITDLAEMSEDLVLEAELDENIRRADLPWQDQVAARARLARLRLSQGKTLTAIAEEIGIDNTRTATIREALEIDQIIKQNENIAKAPSLRQAKRMIADQLGREFAQAITSQLVPNIKHELHQQDAIEYLLTQTGRFDIILTDPPYGISAHKIDGDTRHRHEYNDNWTQVKGLIRRFAEAATYATAPEAHLYMFCDIRRFMDHVPVFDSLGWRVWNVPLIWVKNGGHSAEIDHGPSRRYECILYAIKGEMRLVRTGLSDVLVHPIETKVTYAAAKPVSLFTDLLERSATPGISVVCDPFCGSGPIFPSAKMFDLTAIGVDNSELAIQYAKKRLVEMEMELVDDKA
jgi:ParB-like chromosome segregation protein Spo0J